MGEAAEDALDRMMDVDELECRLAGRDFDDLDDYERDLLFDENGFMGPSVFTSRPDRRVAGVRCRYCGACGLTWRSTPRGWRLASSAGELHSCLAYQRKRTDMNDATQELRETIEQHLADIESIHRELALQGPRIMERLCKKMTLREVARRTGLSATYLSIVANRQQVVSAEACLKLLAIEKEVNRA